MIRFSVFDELTNTTIKLYEDAGSFARTEKYARESNADKEAVTESMVIYFDGIRRDGIANVLAKLNRAGIAARARAINQTGARVWLQAEYSVTTSPTFTMYRTELRDLRVTGSERDAKRDAKNRAEFVFVFTRANWWEMSAEQTLASGVSGRNIVNAQISAGTPAGDMPAPVDLEITCPVQGTGSENPPLWMWLANHALDANVGNLKYWVEPGTLANGGTSLSSFGIVRNMNYIEWNVNAQSMQTLLFSSDMSNAEYLQYMNGRPFRAFCAFRCDSSMVAVWLEFYTTTGGETLLHRTNAQFLPTRLVGMTFCAFDMGMVAMPPGGQAGLSNDTIRVKMFASNYDNAAVRVNVDELLFIPLDSYQMVNNSKSGASQAQPFTEVIRNSDGVAFHRDSTGAEHLTMTTYGELVAFPNGPNMFYMLGDWNGSAGNGVSMTVTLKYRPRYVELPGDYA